MVPMAAPANADLKAEPLEAEPIPLPEPKLQIVKIKSGSINKN
jgi:hypothetical protein